MYPLIALMSSAALVGVGYIVDSGVVLALAAVNAVGASFWSIATKSDRRAGPFLTAAGYFVAGGAVGTGLTLYWIVPNMAAPLVGMESVFVGALVGAAAWNGR